MTSLEKAQACLITRIRSSPSICRLLHPISPPFTTYFTAMNTFGSNMLVYWKIALIAPLFAHGHVQNQLRISTIITSSNLLTAAGKGHTAYWFSIKPFLLWISATIESEWYGLCHSPSMIVMNGDMLAFSISKMT